MYSINGTVSALQPQTQTNKQKTFIAYILNKVEKLEKNVKKGNLSNTYCILHACCATVVTNNVGYT